MKLLNRTIRTYIIFSIITLIVGIPVFYAVIEHLYIQDVDESLVLRKKELQTRVNRIKTQDEIKLWQDLDGDIFITPLNSTLTLKDSIYQTFHFDTLANEIEPYRELSTSITINNLPHRLVIRVSLVESEDLIIGIVKTQVVLLIFLLLGFVFLNRRISKKIWQPFYDTVDKLKQFEIDKNPKIALQSTNIQEFNDLNTAILHLTEKNYTTYLNQKEFTENAAHELQTPLAVFQSKLDLLLQTPNISEEQAEIINVLYDTTMRLSKLNKSLLLLSKIDNEQFVELNEVALEDLINHALSVYSDELKEKNINVTQDILKGKKVKINAALAEILINNLISNAVYHNIPNGTIHIILNGNQLFIKNTGHELNATADSYFERFKKNQSNPNSTGLGLAIVKRIGEVSGLKIAYVTHNNLHQLTISF